MADDNTGDDVFVYTGGRAPRDVRRARICESIDTIPEQAFYNCTQLIEVEGHDKLKKIEGDGFNNCTSLRRLRKMGGVKEVGGHAFFRCGLVLFWNALRDLEFDKLEIIGSCAFFSCYSMDFLNMPSVRRVGECAFQDCEQLRDAVFGESLERIEQRAFRGCPSLFRIAIPLKHGLVIEDRAFYDCKNLSRVDVIGGIHETIFSLHMKSWRDEMKEEIESINQTLPDTLSGWEKTAAINQWIESVLCTMEHYKTEHRLLVKEAMTLLELALWKAKLLDEEGRKCKAEEKKSKTAKIDEENARKEHRVTCGANIVIKNVLPFLALE